MASLVAIRILLVNCPNLALEEAGPAGKLIVHRAIDGNSAVQHCNQHDYRLALIQLPLSDLNPKHLMYYLRQKAESKCHATSVIVIADAKDQALIHEGLQAGVNDYLIAPVSRERLEAVLARFGEFAERKEIKLMIKARIDLPTGDRPFFTQTLNLSRRGLLLLTEKEMLIGAPLELQFNLPGDSRPIKASALIVREAEERKNQKGRVYGVHFTHLDPDDRLRIGDFTRK